MTNPHSVTVTVTPPDDPEDRHEVDVAFTCTAPEDAECRNYPTCDCEGFIWNEDKTHDEAGHVRETGQDCWVEGWFDFEAADYTGSDYSEDHDGHPPVARRGPITVTWAFDYIEWQWDLS